MNKAVIASERASERRQFVGRDVRPSRRGGDLRYDDCERQNGAKEIEDEEDEILRGFLSSQKVTE